MSDCALPGRPHRAEAGLLLCRRHLDQLAADLIACEEEFDDLDPAKSMAIVTSDGGGGGLKNTKAPVRIDAVVARDPRHVDVDELTTAAGADDRLSAFGVLHRWAQNVRDAFDMVPEQAPTVRTERRLLTRELEWCATQPWIDLCFDQIHTLLGQLQALNGTAEPGPLPGRCPRLDEALVECGGHLWPVRADEQRGPVIHTAVGHVQAVECDRDRDHRWEGRDLVRLALAVRAQDQKGSTAA